MKLNIFSIPTTELAGLQITLAERGMTVIREVDQDGWHGEFYYSAEPVTTEASWANAYRDYFSDVNTPTSKTYFAVFLFTKDETCFALSYGKSHFYLRAFSDYDFGIELAKRIANEFDIKQTASKRFQGRRKKDIRSFASNTRLDVESGESVDYIQAGIVLSAVDTFGTTGKFGTSSLLTPELVPSALGGFLTKLRAELTHEARFTLPRTTVITDDEEIARYNQLLVKELLAPVGTTDFAHNSFDLYGIDFIFSTEGTFKLRCPGCPAITFDDISMKDLKTYIVDHNISRENVLKIKIVHETDGRSVFAIPIKQALDFIADDERVILSNGRWMRFNQDYLDYLDEYLAGITVESVEPEFAHVSLTEPEFNQLGALRGAGYELADKDFSIFRTRSSTPIEAWDLKKGKRVYAVKFGTPQKLGYVCDQATSVLELLRNQAGIKQVPDFDSYCLWLGYRSQSDLESITDTGSIIFKQKIETWARKARELGVEPVIKISRKLKHGVDDL